MQETEKSDTDGSELPGVSWRIPKCFTSFMEMSTVGLNVTKKLEQPTIGTALQFDKHLGPS